MKIDKTTTVLVLVIGIAIGVIAVLAYLLVSQEEKQASIQSTKTITIEQRIEARRVCGESCGAGTEWSGARFGTHTCIEECEAELLR